MQNPTNVTQIGGAMGDRLRESVAFVHPAPAADESSWFAVQTKPRHEKRVAAELAEKGITVFLPLVSALHQSTDRRREVTLPLFTNYTFVRIDGERNPRVSVLRTNGVVGFVGMQGRPVPIPDEQINAVQTILREGIPFSLHPFLNVGRKVRIRGGCLDGIQGVILAMNGDQSLIVSIESIQGSLAVRIAGYGLEAA
jgi:transcription antitermination factor NusG